jgi:hypothetical protein
VLDTTSESFDGESTGLRPNRFIEVKSTAADEIVFFWSNNEIDTAHTLARKSVLAESS